MARRAVRPCPCVYGFVLNKQLLDGSRDPPPPPRHHLHRPLPVCGGDSCPCAPSTSLTHISASSSSASSWIWLEFSGHCGEATTVHPSLLFSFSVSFSLFSFFLPASLAFSALLISCLKCSQLYQVNLSSHIISPGNTLLSRSSGAPAILVSRHICTKSLLCIFLPFSAALQGCYSTSLKTPIIFQRRVGWI